MKTQKKKSSGRPPKYGAEPLIQKTYGVPRECVKELDEFVRELKKRYLNEKLIQRS